MSLPAPAEFVLKDDDGQPHNYVMPYHPASDGQRIVCQLAGLLGGPILELVAASQGGGLSNLDHTALSGAVRQAGQVLLSDTPPKLVRDLLRRAIRDGKPLASDYDFDAAYTRNYGELLAVLWEVVQRNRFLPQRFINLDTESPPAAQ